MYIDSFWVIVAIVWIIYLLWRVERLKGLLREAGNLFEYYQKRKEGLERDLVKAIVRFDSELIPKLSKKSQDKILLGQANVLYCYFKRNYAEPVVLGGKLTPVEDEPMHRLGANILGYPVLDSETHTELKITVKDTVRDIKDGLECMIETLD